MISKSQARFIRLNLITIIVTLVVILAGGIVRSTGSGMGCPDWPKCFDQYIPPTSVEQLPADYKEKYVEERIAKNERFAKSLDKLGQQHLADEIRHDPSILVHEEFNAAKTWVEYINRLAGALTGFFMLALAAYSFKYRKIAKRIVVLSVANLFIVGFQAWLGSIVVSTNLLQWVVTVHMLLALLIIAVQIYTYHYAESLYKEKVVVISTMKWLKAIVIAAIAVSLIQIVIGTEVREAIDIISKNLLNAQRDTWVDKVGDIFVYHRDLAILVAILNVLIYKLIMDKFGGKAAELRIGNAIVIVLIIQVLSGLLLSNFALPPYAQAIHLLFSTLLFALQYYLYLLVCRTSTYKH
jgi:cytochrome c oxidase assembly protein subunit 15